jgi:hypothetical protein
VTIMSGKELALTSKIYININFETFKYCLSVFGFVCLYSIIYQIHLTLESS